jgi:hypothetical protein
VSRSWGSGSAKSGSAYVPEPVMMPTLAIARILTPARSFGRFGPEVAGR